eukprot:SAG31_NODE_2428_length_5715_cov_6.736111_4_plen_116_part_00
MSRRIGKAIPRRWLAPGERIIVQNATTSWGRVSFVIEAQPTKYLVNITYPGPTFAPADGIKLRIRAPPPKILSSATIGGKPTPVNATEETIMLPHPLPRRAHLESIIVNVADAKH